MKFWILVSGSFVANILWFWVYFFFFLWPRKARTKGNEEFPRIQFSRAESPLDILMKPNLSNLWANRDFMFNFGITEFWKHAVQVQETCTTFVEGFHIFVRKPQLLSASYIHIINTGLVRGVTATYAVM